MPLRKSQTCILSSKLWEDPAGPYIILEFQRQLSHKLCDLFTKIFDELKTFLHDPRDKKQFKRQVSILAFNLGLIYESIKCFGYDVGRSVYMVGSITYILPDTSGYLLVSTRGLYFYHICALFGMLGLWTIRLLNDPQPILEHSNSGALSALAQIKFLGNSFDSKAFSTGSNIFPIELPVFCLTLQSTEEDSHLNITDETRTLAEILTSYTTPPGDNVVVERPSTLETINYRQISFENTKCEVYDLQQQIQEEEQRHAIRMSELAELQRDANLHLEASCKSQDDVPPLSSNDAQTTQDGNTLDPEMEDRLFFSPSELYHEPIHAKSHELEDPFSVGNTVDLTTFDSDPKFAMSSADWSFPNQGLVEKMVVSAALYHIPPYEI